MTQLSERSALSMILAPVAKTGEGEATPERLAELADMNRLDAAFRFRNAIIERAAGYRIRISDGARSRVTDRDPPPPGPPPPLPPKSATPPDASCLSAPECPFDFITHQLAEPLPLLRQSGLDASLNDDPLGPRETGEALRERGGAGGERTDAGIAGRGIDGVLAARSRSHGPSWTTQATGAQTIKNIYRQCPGWARLLPMQREALDMIAVKVSRILNGDPHYLDHWDDIAGYAKITAREIRRDKSYSE